MQFGKVQKRILKDLKRGCHIGLFVDLNNGKREIWITDDDKGDKWEISERLLNSLAKKGILVRSLEHQTVQPDTEVWRFDLDRRALKELWFPSLIGTIGFWEEFIDREPETF